MIIIQNILGKEIIQVSTISIIGFTLSVIVGGSSLFLAMTAINLSKISETEIVRRNRESIDAQTQILHKSLEVLSDIKTSTGVTEERLNDIKIGLTADKLHSQPNLSRQDIKETLENSLNSEPTDSEKEKYHNREIALEKYKVYHEKVLSVMSETDKLNAIRKHSHGGYHNDGEGLFDCIYEYNDKKIGVSVYDDQEEIRDMFLIGFEVFITKVVTQISKGEIDFFFYVGPKSKKINNMLNHKLTHSLNLLKLDYIRKLGIISGEKNKIPTKIINYLDNILDTSKKKD